MGYMSLENRSENFPRVVEFNGKQHVFDRAEHQFKGLINLRV